MFTIRYLSEQPFCKTPGLSIRGIGLREKTPPVIIQRPKGSGDYLFMLFHDPVQIGSDTRKKSFPAGTMILWDIDAPRFYGNLTQEWSHSWIHCNGPDITRALKNAHIQLNHPLKLLDPSRVESYFLHLHEELSGPFKKDPVIIRNLLINLIRESHRYRNRPQKPPLREGLARAREMVDLQYDKPLHLSMLATVAGMSPAHFCVEFRRCFGVPPIAYLIERRMRVAAMLLGGTTGKIGEIGRRVGYPDPYYFSKHFKAVHGVSPSYLRAPVEKSFKE